MSDQPRVLPLQILATTGSKTVTGGKFILPFLAPELAWQVDNHTGNAVTVTLYGSIDGAVFIALDSSTTATSELRFITGKPTFYLQSKIAATDSNTITVSAANPAFMLS